MQDVSERIDQIQRLLRIHYRNLSVLRIQIAQFTEMEAPVHKITQRDQEQAEIKTLEAELRSLESQQIIHRASPNQQKVSSPQVRVFISSSPDLKKDSQTTLRAIIEKFTSTTAPIEIVNSQSASFEEVRPMIEQNCDIFLGLYGQRYGEAISGHGLSIPEMEYHTAQELGKSILIYYQSGVTLEPAQEKFLDFVGQPPANHTSRKFSQADVPDRLVTWIQQDIQSELERLSNMTQRSTTQGCVLLASLGLSPGAVIGLYDALTEAGKPVSRVVTFSTCYSLVREAAGICRDEFAQLGLAYNQAYFHHYIDVEDIQSEGDAREFKGMFNRLLKENLASGAEVIVGITGGPTVMGALMAIVVQTSAPEHVSMYHLDVDEDIDQDGRLPQLWHFQYDTNRWQELLSPPRDKRRLVQVPYVRFSVAKDR